MKQFLILPLLILSVINGVSQSLFFDNLENSKWASSDSITDVNILDSKGFGLEKLNVPNDSIKINRTIWSFQDSLTITHYDTSSKKETLIGKYEYKKENNLLIIKFNNQPITYTVGIISSGNFVLLSKKKDKRKKKKRTPNKG